jgi:hypothetical protein
VAVTGTALHGKNGAIYLHGKKPVNPLSPQPGEGTKLVNKTEWTLNLNRDYVDSTVFGDTNKTYLVGLRDVQGTFAGLLAIAGDEQVNAATSESIDIYLYADDRTGFELLIASGPGLMDASITASNTDAIKTSGNFRAAGPWAVFSSGTL